MVFHWFVENSRKEIEASTVLSAITRNDPEGHEDTEVTETQRSRGHQGHGDTKVTGTPRSRGHQGHGDTKVTGTQKSRGHKGHRGRCSELAPVIYWFKRLFDMAARLTAAAFSPCCCLLSSTLRRPRNIAIVLLK